MKRILLIGSMIILAGCGAEWFPDDSATVNGSSTSDTVETTDVGTFVSSDRNLDATYTTTATKGTFLTYTSLSVSASTPVAMEKHFDSKTKLLLGQLLRASDKSVLIKQVMTLQ